jgi:DNA-binding HxlR family transcriptional regulator
MSRPYRQHCGISRAMELLGARWALLVVRDLLMGPKRFTELEEGLPGIPTNVLTTRLRELEEAGVVARRVQARPDGGVVYELTDYGMELEQPVLALGFWGAKSLGPPDEDDFISTDALALALRGAFRPREARGPQRCYSLRVDGKSLGVAVKNGKVTVPAPSSTHPDLVIESSAATFTQLFAGALDVEAALESGGLRLTGDESEARRFFEMFRLPS